VATGRGVGVRKPPDPELVRRVCERHRGGESARQISRDAGASEATIRRWIKMVGAERPPPPIMRQPPPQLSPDSLAALPDELATLAARLDGAGATVVRRAIDALAEHAREADEIDVDAPDPDTDMRGWIVHMIHRTQRSYDLAEKSRDTTTATRLAATLEKWAKTLKQYDQSHDGGTITIPRAALAARVQALRDTMRTLTSEPLRCADCDRAVRVSWAEED